MGLDKREIWYRLWRGYDLLGRGNVLLSAAASNVGTSVCSDVMVLCQFKCLRLIKGN